MLLAWCKLPCCIEYRRTGGGLNHGQHRRRKRSTSARCNADKGMHWSSGSRVSTLSPLNRTRNLFASSCVASIIFACGMQTPPTRVTCGRKVGASGASEPAQWEISRSRRALTEDDASGMIQIEKLSLSLALLPVLMTTAACSFRREQKPRRQRQVTAPGGSGSTVAALKRIYGQTCCSWMYTSCRLGSSQQR